MWRGEAVDKRRASSISGPQVPHSRVNLTRELRLIDTSRKRIRTEANLNISLSLDGLDWISCISNPQWVSNAMQVLTYGEVVRPFGD